MSDPQPNLPATVPGSLPLRKPAHEHYAHERALNVAPLEAARRAGYAIMTAGNAAKLDRNPKIRDRIGWLRGQDVEITREKVRRIEASLWAQHDALMEDYWDVVDKKKLDKEGNPILDQDGNVVTIRYQRGRLISEIPRERQCAIENYTVTEDGRLIPKLVSKLAVSAALCKFLGVGAVTREEGDQYSRLADVELIATLKQEAAELGIDVDLTMRFKGSETA